MRLSVVVATVDGGAALARCLAALAAQDLAQAIEVIVPWDARSADAPSAAALACPRARLLELGEIATAHPPASLLALHERIDRRRAAGLAAAAGDVVALIEDRVVPRPDWARRLLEAHSQHPEAAVIGGAVERGGPSLLHAAVYYCDYGRYQPPFAAGPAEWLSDVNVSYARRALEQTRELWSERYHESSMHWALREAGEVLWATPAPVVQAARGPLTLAGLLRERVAFGRVFGWTRAREASLGERLARCALAPALPFLLVGRRVAERARRGSAFGARFAAALPAIFLLSCAWALGEALAHATGRA